MKRLWMILLLGATLFPLNACAASTLGQVKLYSNVTTEVAFRAWNQKGLGEVLGQNTVSVITAQDRTKGDIVILRWSEDGSHFNAEVYRADPKASGSDEWNLVSADQQKTLTDQNGKYFLILELVPGREGGQKTERFTLPEE